MAVVSEGGPMTLVEAGESMIQQIKETTPKLESKITSAKARKAIRFKKMVHILNRDDPFHPLYRKVNEVHTRKARWATDEKFRNRIAEKMGCAIFCKEPFDFVWRPESGDPLELPK